MAVRRTPFVLAVLFVLASTVSALGHPLEIHIINVGQADATLIVGPERTLLIDAGEEMTGPKTHYKEIAAYIRKVTGKSRIDYFVISHYHFDHMGSMKGTKGNGVFGLIQEGIRIGAILDRGDDTEFGEGTGPHDAYRKVVKDWVKKKAVGRRVTARLGSDQIKLGGAVVVSVVAVNSNGVLERVNKEKPNLFEKCPPSENDYSVALKITYGPFEYFSGGDLAGVDNTRDFGFGCTSYNDVESEIAASIGNVEVMKLNHHGSPHSSNEMFIKTLAPEVIVVTSGTGNGYRHPSREVMERVLPYGSVLITGGVSDKEWTDDELLKGMTIVDDTVRIMVNQGGSSYETVGRKLRAFSDAEELAELDRKHFAEEPNFRRLVRPAARDHR